MGEVEDLLAGCSVEVSEVAEKLRALIKVVAPDAQERVYGGWQVIAYTYSCAPGMQGQFCAQSPQRTRVNLEFYRGADLPDPQHLLEGTGKNLRHVKITTPADVERPGLRELIASAAGLARAG